MDLRTALAHALPFAGTDGYVLVEPAVFHEHLPIILLGDRTPLPHVPAKVSAHDGETGVVIMLDPDEDVPLVGLAAAPLRKALPVTPDSLEVIAQGASAALRERGPVVGSGSTPSVLTVPVHAAPAQLRTGLIPPEWMRPVSLATVVSVARVTHATVDDPDRPLLQRLHLTPQRAEATDQSRVARATHGGLVPSGMLVPPDVFQRAKHSRPGALGAAVGVTDGWWWLQLGEELRFARTAPDADFMRLDELVDLSPCFEAVVFGPALHTALAKASKTSTAGVVELVLGDGACGVSGMDAEGAPTSHERLLAATNTREVVRLSLRASYARDAVAAALDRQPDPLVLRYRSPYAPIQVERGSYTETVWPLCPEEGVTHATDH